MILKCFLNKFTSQSKKWMKRKVGNTKIITNLTYIFVEYGYVGQEDLDIMPQYYPK